MSTVTFQMAHREDRVVDDATKGQDPTEEVGPEEASATQQESEFKAGELEERADASHPKFAEEILEAYQPETELVIESPIDGLPIPAHELSASAIAFAPPFTHENVVCTEDARTWVEVFGDDVVGSVEAEKFVSVYGQYHLDTNHSFRPPRVRYDVDGDEIERKTFTPAQVSKHFGIYWGSTGNSAEGMYPVVPVRPVCEFYKRQVFSNDSVQDPDAPGHKIVFRNCTARRSIGGAFLSLRDEAIYACDYRSPPEPVSVKRFLDDPDNKRIMSNEHKIKLPLFKGSGA